MAERTHPPSLRALREILRPRKARRSPEERAALDARDRSLLERFLSSDKAAGRELVQRLDKMGLTWAWRLWPRLAVEWEDFRGAYFEVLQRYREEGLLRLDEPLVFLSRRLLKQAGRKAGIEVYRELAALSFQQAGATTQELRERQPGDENPTWGDWLETQAAGAMAAEPRFEESEVAVYAQQQLAWIQKAADELNPAQRMTFEAEKAVARGEFPTLAEALGVAEGTAYNRRSAMKASLRRMAEEDGELEILRRLKARAPRKPSKKRSK